jgi:RND superfamily putative drug exporter
VFLLSRMREEWDNTHDNEHAVAFGLEHTGRIITAAAIIMIAAFSGFTTGRLSVCRNSGSGSRPRSCSMRRWSGRCSCPRR